MAQGALDHPNYTVHQTLDMDTTTAGANGTSAAIAFVSDMRLRKAAATVRVAGTSATSGNQVIFLAIGTCTYGFTTASGTGLTTSTTTATLGTIVLGSSVANIVTTSTDMNALLKAGCVLALKNGTDATGTAKVILEIHLDPLAAWSGP